MRDRRRQPVKSGEVSSGPSKTEETPVSSPATSADNLVVGASILGVLLSILIAVKFITPIFLTAAIVPFFLQAMRKGLHRRAAILTARWAITVFICVVITGGFVTSRAEKTFPYAKQSVHDIQDWIAGTNDVPPADFKLLLAGGLAFTAAALVSGGVLGFILASLLIGGSACGSAYMFQQGDNIFHILVIAVQPWLLCLFAAGIFLIIPAAYPTLHRFLHKTAPADKKGLLRFVYAGAGLFILSILLRLTTMEAWRALTERWTVS